jgi:hypothetical protein
MQTFLFVFIEYRKAIIMPRQVQISHNAEFIEFYVCSSLRATRTGGQNAPQMVQNV